MKFGYPLLMLVIAGIAFSAWFVSLTGTTPTQEALAFIDDIQTGNLSQTVKHFGGYACRCPAKGGWGTYLIYPSGQEANLAFLMGHQFKLGKAQVFPIQNPSKYLLPWEKSEDYIVDIPLDFEVETYSPLFLPLPLAYGQDMSHQAFENFLKNPKQDAWKAFSLRLRPSLAKGTIYPDRRTISQDYQSEFPSEKSLHTGDQSDTLIQKTFGKEAATYLHPKDAGSILDEQSKPILPREIEQQLPRLQSTILRLHLVRRGQLENWTVFHFGFLHSVIRSMKDKKSYAITNNLATPDLLLGGTKNN